MGWNDSSANTRSRVVRLRFARRLAGVEDIRLKGVAKWTEVTFEMVRMRAPLALFVNASPGCRGAPVLRCEVLPARLRRARGAGGRGGVRRRATATATTNCSLLTHVGAGLQELLTAPLS